MIIATAMALRLVVGWLFLVTPIGCGASVPAGSDLASPPVSCVAPEYVAKPATAWPCPSAAAVRSIESDIRVVFDEDPTAGDFACREGLGSADLTPLQERVFQALHLIQRAEFDAPLPWTGQRLWDWFVYEVRGIRVGGSRTFCCEPARVIRIAVPPTSDSGLPDLVEGLIHEARHADSQHPHTCGASADNTIAELGAYGVQYYLNLWLAEHSIAPRLTPEERRYSASRAALMRYYSFCRECR